MIMYFYNKMCEIMFFFDKTDTSFEIYYYICSDLLLN